MVRYNGMEDFETPDDPVVRAYHEAGHAIVAMALGWQVKEVTVETEGLMTPVPKEVPLIEFIAVLAAGSAAEARYSNMSTSQFGGDGWDECGSKDYQLVMPKVLNAFGNDRRPSRSAVKVIWDGAYSLLGEPAAWAAVSQLAIELAAGGTMTGERAQEIWEANSEAHPLGARLAAVWKDFEPLRTVMVEN